LQQHNGQKAGGAKATHGRQWRRVALVSHFPDSTAALQFEWAWKFRSRRRGRGLQARLAGLQDVLQSPQATSKARPFAEWPEPPLVWLEEGLALPT
jgi:predicted GIY-YIG superfamily endonuclease